MIAYCFATEVDYSDLTIAEVRGQFIISITEIENARRERIGTTLVEQTSVRESGEKLNVREAATVNVLRIYLRTYNPAAPEEIKDLLAQVKSIDTLVVNEFVTHLCIPIRLKKLVTTLHLDFVEVSSTFKEESAFADFTALRTLILQKVPSIGNGKLVENVSMAANRKLKKFKMIAELLDEDSMNVLLMMNCGVKLELESYDVKQLALLMGTVAVMTHNNIIFNINVDDIEIEIPENYTPPALIRTEIFKDIKTIDNLIVRVNKDIKKDNSYFDDVFFPLTGSNIIRHLTCLNIKSSEGDLRDVILSLAQEEVEIVEEEEEVEGEEQTEVEGEEQEEIKGEEKKALEERQKVRQVLESLTFTTKFPTNFKDQLACIQAFQKNYKHELSNLTKIRMIITNSGIALDTANWENLGVTVSDCDFPGEINKLQVVEIPIDNQIIN